MKIDGITQDITRALNEFAERSGRTRDAAALHIMTDWLTCHGYLERKPEPKSTRRERSRIGLDGRDREQVQYPSYYESDGSL